ncbi:hypothetical protein N8K70_04855 [Microbacterium betulae]|uniref:Sugar ABC transporter ATPase n=1 Tax=Microbacterium betulae TaxID=2981139 RepID=A0AA97FIW8_9MICO|nr:hypothetical protein [Microbacterium sp. AB]WOF24011.1 hypothetical protein N8K70_04855 [Microbacterium sp. AB]
MSTHQEPAGDDLAPETQGDDPLAADLGEDGQGDITPDGSVPAGRGGADSGATDLVDVEGEVDGSPDSGEQNDIAGVGPALPEDPALGREDAQTEPREDVPAASADERIRGILVQVQADLSTDRLTESGVSRMLAQRLHDAQIAATDEDLEALAREAVSGGPPTTIEESQPGSEA